jgi:hypothetical protein
MLTDLLVWANSPTRPHLGFPFLCPVPLKLQNTTKSCAERKTMFGYSGEIESYWIGFDQPQKKWNQQTSKELWSALGCLCLSRTFKTFLRRGWQCVGGCEVQDLTPEARSWWAAWWSSQPASAHLSPASSAMYSLHSHFVHPRRSVPSLSFMLEQTKWSHRGHGNGNKSLSNAAGFVRTRHHLLDRNIE